jgi:hypothetical protein
MELQEATLAGSPAAAQAEAEARGNKQPLVLTLAVQPPTQPLT